MRDIETEEEVLPLVAKACDDVTMAYNEVTILKRVHQYAQGQKRFDTVITSIPKCFANGVILLQSYQQQGATRSAKK